MPPQRQGYRKIAADLKERIYAGEYPPGSRLPSYASLARIYGVSVTTVQSALRQLRTEALVTGEVGIGVFVVDPLPDR
jgi:GntR family transcriptional regulator